MLDIAIERSHPLTPQQARQAAETFAEHLANRHEISYRWEGDSLHFQRSGIDGQIELVPGSIRVNVRLGWLLTPFKQRLEQEIHRHLDEIFPLLAAPDAALPLPNAQHSATTSSPESHL
jgi:putative polyhydroxyalkanoate system protein